VQSLKDSYLDRKDTYAKKLRAERARIEGLESDFKANLAKTDSQLLETYKAARAHAEDLIEQWHAANQAGYTPEHSAEYDAAMAAAKSAEDNLKNWQAQGRQQSYNDFIEKQLKPAQARFVKGVALNRQVIDSFHERQRLDAEYWAARDKYNAAVTQHDKDRAAYDMYKAQKAVYDQDSLNREADIKAGRYAVNPYQFLAQGADLNEIEELRKQVNAGNLRPNMRVPGAAVAPTEVKDPGEFQEAAPEHKRSGGPTDFDPEAAALIGYTGPKTFEDDDKPLNTVSTAETDVSGVTSGYQSPSDKEKEPEPETDASGNPVVAQTPAQNLPPTTNNLQATSTGAQAAPTQQTATQAATPAPKLPPQESGAVAGQGNNTGQAPVADPAQPPKEQKPKPFSEDNKEQDEDKNVW
jgi:hypothetical protein